MTAAQYRAAIKKLGLSQRAAAKFFGVNERTSRRWAESGPPASAAKFLLAMIQQKLKPADLEQSIDRFVWRSLR